MADDPPLRLKWRKTWPDRENDFVAVDPRYFRQSVGRMYVHESRLEGARWWWAMNAFGRHIARPVPGTGFAATPREAAALVEAAWFEAIRDAPEGAELG